MNKSCVLYDRTCSDCGECDKCDLNSSRVCNNCGKCIDETGEFRSLDVVKFIDIHADSGRVGSKEDAKVKIKKVKK